MAGTVVLTGDYTVAPGQVISLSDPWANGQIRVGVSILNLGHVVLKVDGRIAATDNAPDEQYDPAGVTRYFSTFANLDPSSLVHRQRPFGHHRLLPRPGRLD